MSSYLFIMLFICHYLADYTWLSTHWMLAAKRFGKPFFPILVHAGIHATLMGIAMMIYFQGGAQHWPVIAKLIAFEGVTHFTIDVWKGRMNGWFPVLLNPANELHWIIFGFDQLLHSIVIILMVQFATN